MIAALLLIIVVCLLAIGVGKWAGVKEQKFMQETKSDQAAVGCGLFSIALSGCLLVGVVAVVVLAIGAVALGGL